MDKSRPFLARAWAWLKPGLRTFGAALWSALRTIASQYAAQWKKSRPRGKLILGILTLLVVCCPFSAARVLLSKPSATPTPTAGVASRAATLDLAAAQPSTTLQPSAAPSVTPRPPTATPRPSDTPAPSNTPAPTKTPRPSNTPAPSATPKPTDTPAPTIDPALQAAGAYIANYLAESQRLSDAMSEISVLSQNPLFTDNTWRTELAMQMAIVKSVHSKMTDIVPPDDLAAVHQQFLQGSADYDQAMDTLATAIDNVDADLMDDAVALVTSGNAKTNEANTMLLTYIEALDSATVQPTSAATGLPPTATPAPKPTLAPTVEAQPTAAPSTTVPPTVAPPTAIPPTSAPAAAKIVIAATQRAGTPESITIKNIGSAPQDMTGWQLVSVKGDQRFAFPNGFALEPGASVVVYSGPGAQHNPPAALSWGDKNIWNNDGDPAQLLDNTGKVVDDA